MSWVNEQIEHWVKNVLEKKKKNIPTVFGGQFRVKCLMYLSVWRKENQFLRLYNLASIEDSSVN